MQGSQLNRCDDKLRLNASGLYIFNMCNESTISLSAAFQKSADPNVGVDYIKKTAKVFQKLVSSILVRSAFFFIDFCDLERIISVILKNTIKGIYDGS